MIEGADTVICQHAGAAAADLDDTGAVQELPSPPQLGGQVRRLYGGRRDPHGVHSKGRSARPRRNT